MRRTRVACVGGVLAIAAVLVTAAIALGSGGRELTGPVTIRLESTGGHAAFFQLNPNTKSDFGDKFVIAAPLSKAGEKVGRLHAECTFYDKAGVHAECTGTFFLHGGEVMARGPVDFGVNNRTVGAITGGSGRYRNARGQVVFVNSTGNTEGFIFQLEP